MSVKNFWSMITGRKTFFPVMAQECTETIAGKAVYLPASLITHHMLFVGAPGAGKTVLALHLITDAVRKGVKVVMSDAKPEFGGMKNIYDPDMPKETRAIRLNPHDKLSVPYNIFKDLRSREDCDEAAESLYTRKPGEADEFFAQTAKKVVADLFYALIKEDKRTWGHVLEYLFHAKAEEGVPPWGPLHGLLDKYPETRASAAQLSTDPTLAKRVDSTWATILTKFGYLRIFHRWADVQIDDPEAFSLADYVQNDADRRSLILSYQPRYKIIMAPVLKWFYTTILRANLAKPDRAKGASGANMIVFTDEMADILGYADDSLIQTYMSALTMLRSKGTAMFSCIQDFGFIGKGLGRELLETFINCHGILVAGHINDAASLGDRLSKAFGTHTIQSYTHGVSVGQDPVSDRFSGSWQMKDAPVVSVADLVALHPCHYYVKINHAITKFSTQFCEITWNDREVAAPIMPVDDTIYADGSHLADYQIDLDLLEESYQKFQEEHSPR